MQRKKAGLDGGCGHHDADRRNRWPPPSDRPKSEHFFRTRRSRDRVGLGHRLWILGRTACRPIRRAHRQLMPQTTILRAAIALLDGEH